MIGVAISTTGDDHRLGFLETCVRAWDQYLPVGSRMFVTVDGDADATYRAANAVKQFTESVFQVGQPSERWYSEFGMRDGRIGVAANKNTGLELLMGVGVDHLFLCDDDTWPTHPDALRLHLECPTLHNMICWGAGRKPTARAGGYTTWSWPRGVMMYAHRRVIEHVGGFVEAFGPGGHEHVEWSKRITNAGLVPHDFPSPEEYSLRNGRGVQTYWHCSDIERKHQTTVRRKGSDWEKINKIMEQQAGQASFVPYSAHANAREYATLCSHLSGDRGVAAAKEPGRE